jgi:hypothetical protein
VRKLTTLIAAAALSLGMVVGAAPAQAVDYTITNYFNTKSGCNSGLSSMIREINRADHLRVKGYQTCREAKTSAGSKGRTFYYRLTYSY